MERGKFCAHRVSKRVGLRGRPCRAGEGCVALHRVPYAWARDVGGWSEARVEVRARRSRVASCWWSSRSPARRTKSTAKACGKRNGAEKRGGGRRSGRGFGCDRARGASRFGSSAAARCTRRAFACMDCMGVGCTRALCARPSSGFAGGCSGRSVPGRPPRNASGVAAMPGPCSVGSRVCSGMRMDYLQKGYEILVTHKVPLS